MLCTTMRSTVWPERGLQVQPGTRADERSPLRPRAAKSTHTNHDSMRTRVTHANRTFVSV